MKNIHYRNIGPLIPRLSPNNLYSALYLTLYSKLKVY